MASITGGNCVYFVSTFITLVTTIVIVYIARKSHPHTANDIDLLTRLNDEASCALCHASYNQYEIKQSDCSKCNNPDSFRARSSDSVGTGYMLTPSQEKTIREAIRRKFQNKYRERIDRAFDKFKHSHNLILNRTKTIRENAGPVVQCFSNHYAPGQNHKKCHEKRLTSDETEIFRDFSQRRPIYRHLSEKFQVTGWYDIHFQVKLPRDSLMSYGNFSALLTTWRKNTGSQVKPIQKTEGDYFASNIGHISSSDVVLSGHAISRIFADDHLELLIRTPTTAEIDLQPSIYISALFLRGSS